MDTEQQERRTLEAERERFEELKQHVASDLNRVAERMPQPWFDELVDSVTRLRARCLRQF